ncbi:MAG: glycosyltransferase [Rhizomicrobium sp.]|nr:glycosyltransferase [Rhizomicrobium sp.]
MQASIIMPTYNSSAYIETCIENARAQGDVVSEHIIADGGSTDGTVEIVARLKTKYPYLSLLPGPDKGQSDALNKATAAATAPFIGILNCDDTYEPMAVSQAIALMQTLPQPAFVTGNCLFAVEGGDSTMTRPKDLRVESLLLGPDLVRFPANPASYFYSKDIHDLVGGYDVDDHYAMDFDFIIKCALKTKLHYVDQHWGNFYLHAGCKTLDNNFDAAAQLAAIIARYQKDLTPEQLKNQARIRILKTFKAAVRKTRDRLKRAAKTYN